MRKSQPELNILPQAQSSTFSISVSRRFIPKRACFFTALLFSNFPFSLPFTLWPCCIPFFPSSFFFSFYPSPFFYLPLLLFIFYLASPLVTSLAIPCNLSPLYISILHPSWVPHLRLSISVLPVVENQPIRTSGSHLLSFLFFP